MTLKGKVVSLSEDKLEDAEIVYEKVILPTSFHCYSCGLKLSNHQELSIVGYGGQFTENVTWDPAEYYGIQVNEADASQFYDYDND